MRALRHCLGHLTSAPALGQDLPTRLRQAVTDNYVRKSSKRARYRPPNPDKKSLGNPKVRTLTAAEKKQLQSINCQKTAASNRSRRCPLGLSLADWLTPASADSVRGY